MKLSSAEDPYSSIYASGGRYDVNTEKMLFPYSFSRQSVINALYN